MIQNLIEVAKSLLQYSLHFLLITIVLFVSFFIFARYKSEQELQKIFALYVQIFTRALSLTLTLLLLIILVTTYVPMCSLAVVMLAISSIVIVLQYVDLIKAEKNTIVGLIILLSNAYVIYLAITQEPLLVEHYVVLYAVALYAFLSQRFRVVYHKN